MYKIVLVRHGESTWNKENRFTGWTDVDLNEKGIEEAHIAGKALKNENYIFDIAYTSVLKRAIRTLWIILEEMDLMWLNVNRSWRLNERHYGALQGLNKAETSEKFGEEQVHLWRRSYDVPPPDLTKNDERYPGFDPRYKFLTELETPKSECLKDTVERFLPLWHQEIAPTIHSGKRVLIVAHGNSLRALIKYIDDVPDDRIVGFNVPTGIPLVFELNAYLKPIRHYFLGDPNEVRKAMGKVANQAKVRKKDKL